MVDSLNYGDNLEKYKEFIPKEIEKHLPLYRGLITQIAHIQEKLEKNFYRVTDIEKLKEAVAAGKIKPAKYSIIEEVTGGYQLVKFSDFFESEFSKIITSLQKIEKDIVPGKYKDYLNALIVAYKNNNFIDPYKKWVQLTSEDYPVDFILLPTEPDLDKVFGSILSFDASLRVHAPDFLSYKKDEDYVAYLTDSVKMLPKLSEIHYGFAEGDLKLQIRVDYCIFSAGVHFKRRFYGQNLPNERAFVLNWGSKILVYKNLVDEFSSNGASKLAKEIFDNYTLSYAELTTAISEKLLVHEVTEALMKFEGEEERLGKHYFKVREMNSEMSGIKNYILFMLKMGESSRQMHNLSTAYILSAFDYYRRKHAPENRSAHYYGYVSAINYFLESGGIQVDENKKLRCNVKIILKSISNLSQILVGFLMKGTEQEAEEFFEKYSSEELFKRTLNIE